MALNQFIINDLNPASPETLVNTATTKQYKEKLTSI